MVGAGVGERKREREGEVQQDGSKRNSGLSPSLFSSGLFSQQTAIDKTALRPIAYGTVDEKARPQTHALREPKGMKSA